MKTRNFLRIYANLGKETYTDAEKEILVKSFIAIGEEIFGEKHLRFDIDGSGYGISKGDPLVTAKTFWSKIDKKGYKNFYGMSAKNKDYWKEKTAFQSEFSLLLQSHNFFRFEAGFFWISDEKYDNETALKIIQHLENVVNINYAYGYLADEILELSEWISKNGITSFPKSEEIWNGQIGDIPQGQIKQIYDFNVFNAKQIEKLDCSPKTKISLKNGLEVWLLN